MQHKNINVCIAYIQLIPSKWTIMRTNPSSRVDIYVSLLQSYKLPSSLRGLHARSLRQELKQNWCTFCIDLKSIKFRKEQGSICWSGLDGRVAVVHTTELTNRCYILNRSAELLCISQTPPLAIWTVKCIHRHNSTTITDTSYSWNNGFFNMEPAVKERK